MLFCEPNSLLLKENCILQKPLNVLEGRRGGADSADGLEAMLSAGVRRLDHGASLHVLGASGVHGGREGLAHVLGEPVQRERRLVGADVNVLGDSLAGAFHLLLELGVRMRLL